MPPLTYVVYVNTSVTEYSMKCQHDIYTHSLSTKYRMLGSH